jgi:hypothetical protein
MEAMAVMEIVVDKIVLLFSGKGRKVFCKIETRIAPMMLTKKYFYFFNLWKSVQSVVKKKLEINCSYFSARLMAKK